MTMAKLRGRATSEETFKEINFAFIAIVQKYTQSERERQIVRERESMIGSIVYETAMEFGNGISKCRNGNGMRSMKAYELTQL